MESQIYQMHGLIHLEEFISQKNTKKFEDSIAQGAYNVYYQYQWANSKRKPKKSILSRPVQQNNASFVLTDAPFLICEVLNVPEFINDEDDAKKGWIFCNSREDLVPLYLVYMSNHLTIDEIENATTDVIQNQLFEERINAMWKIIRWFVMGAKALTWIIEYHSVLQGLPVDLILTICNTMIRGDMV